jgi:ATP-dependent RNA helicase DeaD
VGHNNGVKPGNIVGAIANEAGLDSKMIGQIEIFDDYSVVDLPDGMPKNVFQDLQKAWVCQQQLKISMFSGAGAKSGQSWNKKGKGRKSNNRAHQQRKHKAD